MIILHFALKNEWDSESLNGSYGINCITRNGYIPCFNVSDIKNTQISLSTLKDYIILCIDTNKLENTIKNEIVPISNTLCPCIYGNIPSNAIVEILPYTFNDNDIFTPSEELLDFEIINEICSKLNIPYKSKKYFHDGTTSRIILLNNEFIIKMAEKEQLKAEATFANYYSNVPSLQKIAYADPEYKFLVYNFIPGDVMHTVTDFEDLARNIKVIVSAYKNFSSEFFGYVDTPVDSWTKFLKNEVEHSAEYFSESKNLLPTVYDAIEELNKYPFNKKLIHGDFGTHNFIKRDEKFIAAIDPTPVIGDATYDLLYALVSNVDLLPFLSMNYLTSYIKEPKTKIETLLKVVLFCRIGKCVKYNKEALDTYLDFWYNLFK